MKMIGFIYITIICLLFECCAVSKKSKPCKQCPQYSYTEIDTTIITIPHHNYNGMCFPESKIIVVEEEEILIEQL